MFIPLTTHSAYSLQEGLLLPSELIEKAKSQNLPALGLTDHRLLSGSVEFAVACQRAGIQPVLGLEIDLSESKLVLLAMNLNGWSNLCRLSSAMALREDPEAASKIDHLVKFSDDLIAIIPSPSQATMDESAPLVVLKVIFKDRLYAALDDPQTAVRRSMLAHKLKNPLCGHPPHLLSLARAGIPAAHPVRDTIKHSSEQAAPRRDRAERFSFPLPAGHRGEVQQLPLCYRSHAGDRRALQIRPAAGGRTHAHRPAAARPDRRSNLRQKAEAGAVDIYGGISPQVRERLDHELEVIARMGFEPIFLIVEEILNFARQTGVPFSSRGSAASSLVAHCLGITSPDPLRLDLYFERFLNPARTTPPDIDTDLCSRGRDRVIQHVFDTYGAERVAMVGTINRFRPRSALGDVAKAHGIDPQKVREMVNQLPYAFWARFEESEEGETPPSPFAELRAAYTSPSTSASSTRPKRCSNCRAISRCIPADWSSPPAKSPTWCRSCARAARA